MYIGDPVIDGTHLPGWLQLFVPMMLLSVWTIPWKGYALWKSARRGSKVWFIALLLINTLALLEILYIFIFSKKKSEQPNTNEIRPKINTSNQQRAQEQRGQRI